MRELDGLSHDEVARRAGDHAAASRQLVKRARSGLVAAAEARDADCAAIRDVLLTAHDERRRPSEHALRHLKRCGACREFRDGLKATRSRLRALVPPIGLGPLAGVLHLVGGGAAATSKVAARRRCAVLAAGGATRLGRGEHKSSAARRPGPEVGGRQLIGKPIRAGTKLPSNVAIATSPSSCSQPSAIQARGDRALPGRMGAAGLAKPRMEDGIVAIGQLAHVPVLRPRRGRARRGGRGTAASSTYAAKTLTAPIVVRVGTLCKRR